MNIEEAIDKVDRFVNTITVILPKYSTAIPEYCIDEESWIAIKKVLTAYEKEKDKNKELENCLQMAKQIMTANISEDFGFMKLKEFENYLLNEIKQNENFEE